MTRKQALAELIAAFDAGTLESVSAEHIYIAFGKHLQRRFWECWHGSLDAAKALRMSILPGPVPEKIHSDAREELLSILRELIDLERA